MAFFNKTRLWLQINLILPLLYRLRYWKKKQACGNAAGLL